MGDPLHSAHYYRGGKGGTGLGGVYCVRSCYFPLPTGDAAKGAGKDTPRASWRRKKKKREGHDLASVYMRCPDLNRSSNLLFPFPAELGQDRGGGKAGAS